MSTQLIDAPLTTKRSAGSMSGSGSVRETSSLPVIDPQAWATHFETRSPQSLLSWAVERWRDRLALVTSFQATGMVLLDMAWRLDPDIRVITLDTGRLPQETYDAMEAVRRRYGVEIEIVSPDAAAVQALVRDRGPNLFYESLKHRQSCCSVRKVEPLSRALEGAGAWLTGLRRDQTESRQYVQKVSFDAEQSPDLVKLAPLAAWTEHQVEQYIKENAVPRHPLYAKGYRSIGCAPCTRPVVEGADPRSGRWWWEQGNTKECGIHLPVLPAGTQ